MLKSDNCRRMASIAALRPFCIRTSVRFCGSAVAVRALIVESIEYRMGTEIQRPFLFPFLVLDYQIGVTSPAMYPWTPVTATGATPTLFDSKRIQYSISRSAPYRDRSSPATFWPLAHRCAGQKHFPTNPIKPVHHRQRRAPAELDAYGPVRLVRL